MGWSPAVPISWNGKDLTEIRLEGPADLKLLPSREMESAEVLRWPASARDLKDIAQAGPGAAAEVVRQEGEWVIPGAEPGYVYLVTGNWPEGYVDAALDCNLSFTSFDGITSLPT